MSILAYKAQQIGREVIIECSDGRTLQTADWHEASGFILMPCDFCVCWNIDQFAKTLTSLLPKSEQNKLLENNGRIFTSDNRKLYYQQSRCFAVNQITAYGLSRYADNEPDSVSALLKLGNDVISAFSQLGVIVTNLSSPVSAYSPMLELLPFPRACDLPSQAEDMICECSKIMTNEFRELYKIGFWKSNECFDADLSSAYPSLIAKLPDLSDAKFFTSKSMNDIGTWGIMKGKLRLVKDVHPFAQDTNLITTSQYRMLKEWNIGDFEIEQGWYFRLHDRTHLSKPFEAAMTTLYQERQSSELLKKICKGISVGIYGYLAQTYDDGKLGKFANPIYALMATSQCSTKVCDFIYSNSLESRIISVLVDGVLCEGQPPNLPEFNGMGSWRINEPSDALVVSLLYQWLADKKPNMMTIEPMLDYIKKHPKSSILPPDIDLKLMDYSRNFPRLPKCGQDLLEYKYDSTPKIC